MKFWFGEGKPQPSFDEVVAGDYSVCGIPITGNMMDPTFSQRLQEHVDTLKVYCKPLHVGASPQQRDAGARPAGDGAAARSEDLISGGA